MPVLLKNITSREAVSGAAGRTSTKNGRLAFLGGPDASFGAIRKERRGARSLGLTENAS